MFLKLKNTLNIIKQGNYNRYQSVDLVLSGFNLELINFLQREGFITIYQILWSENIIRVFLNYNLRDIVGLIRNFNIWSNNKRSLKNFSVSEIKLKKYKKINICLGSEFKVFLTSRGLLSLDDCLKLNIGGFLLFSIVY